MTQLPMSIVFVLLFTAGATASKAREQALEAVWSNELEEQPAILVTPSPETKVVTYKSPVKRVVILLKQMKAELEAEAGKEGEMYDKLVCWCETNDKEKTKAIADAEAKIESLTEDIKAKSAKIGELESEIKNTKTQIAEDTEALKKAEALRAAGVTEFRAEEKDMLQDLDNLKNAISVLSKHYGGSEFLQLDSPMMVSVRAVLQSVALKYDLMSGSDHPHAARPGAKRAGVALLAVDTQQSMTDELAKALGDKQEENMPADLAARFLAEYVKKAPSGNSFMQAGSKAPGWKSYNARSSTIFGILNQMKEEFETSLSQAQKDDAKASVDFETLKKTKTEQIEAAKEKLDVMETELAATVKGLSDDKDEHDATMAQRSADVEFLRNLKVTCQNMDRDYDDRTATRALEIKAVSETIAVLTEDDNRELIYKSVTLLQKKATVGAEAKARRSRAAAFLWKAARSPSFADDLLAEWHGRSTRKHAAAHTSSRLAALAVSVQLDGFTKVKAVMDKLVADMKKEQQEEVEFKAECVKDLDVNSKSIFTNSEDKADLEAKIESLEKTMATLKKEILAAKLSVNETQLEIKKAGQVREEENADFQTTVADQRATQDILLKALAKMKEFYGKKEKEALLQDVSGQEPPVKFDEYKVNAGASPVMSLLEQIIGDSKSLESEATAAEYKSQADYETFVKDSNDVIASLTESIASKTAASNAAAEELAIAKGDLEDKTEELEQLDELKIQLHAKCDWVMKNFAIRQKARQQNIDAVLQAKYILSGAKE